MGDLLTRVYRGGDVFAEGSEIDDVADHLDGSDGFVWVDVGSPTADQLRDLAARFGLHELAVEASLGDGQRPRLNHYPNHLFLSARAVEVESDGLRETEVGVFVGPGWIVSVRPGESPSRQALIDRIDRSADLAAHGPGSVLYVLVDMIVDGYFDVIEAFDEYYDEVAEGIFNEHPLEPTKQRDWFQARREMVRFHRLVVPMREAISALMLREQGVVSEGLYPYFQDVYDHMLRVTEASDSLRDLVATIVETNLSLRDYRQNLIVKRVSSWAAIISVPAVITGYYGMNVPFPGFGTVGGAIVSTALIVVSSLVLYILFRRRDWL